MVDIAINRARAGAIAFGLWIAGVWIAPSARRALGVASVITAALPFWIAISRLAPFVVGYTLLSAVTCAVFALLVMAFAAWTRPGSAARLRRLGGLAFVLLPLAAFGTPPDHRTPLQAAAFYAALVDVAFLASGLVISAIAGFGRLGVGLVDRRRASRGDLGLEDTVMIHFRAAAPAVQGSAVVGAIAVIWMATSWLYGLGDPRQADLRWLGFVQPVVGFMDGLAKPGLLMFAVAACTMCFAKQDDLDAARTAYLAAADPLLQEVDEEVDR